MKSKYTLTKIEKLQMHRLMWLWISEDEKRTKRDWHFGLRWSNDYVDEEGCAIEGMIEYPLYGCFLCDLFHDNNLMCVKCPLYQMSGGFCENNGPYEQCKAGINCAENARKIAHCVDSLLDKLELGW